MGNNYFEPSDIVSDVCNCSAGCLMTFSFHCIACAMNVRSMFFKLSVCLQGVFDLDFSVPRSRLSLRHPAAAHTSGAEAQPKVRCSLRILCLEVLSDYVSVEPVS